MYADYDSKSDRMRGRRNLRILIFYFSVMKKSKMDWEAHRKKDNLEEELNNVKNSKKSIVDKNDFLLRTDHRTFELEREERLKRINNRKNN